MLVLSRKVGERIHIGNDVYVEVRRVAGSRVTVAICAPKNVRILRGELLAASRECDVLDDSTADVTAATLAEASEATIDTVIMSGEQAAVALPSGAVSATDAVSSSDALSPSEVHGPALTTEPSETAG
jgi:carbon storage regulator CsrA